MRPGAFDVLSLIREGRTGGELPHWPDWCWVPVSVVAGVLAGGLADGTARPPDDISDDASALEAAWVTAVAAWRQTQGVYRFDPDVLDELWRTPASGDLPADVLERLPEWCVYFETPARAAFYQRLAGFYASLDFDAPSGRRSLRLVLDTDAGLLPVPVVLRGSLGEAVALLNAEAAAAVAEGAITPDVAGVGSGLLEAIEPLVSLVLYLCSEAAELVDRKGRQSRPRGFADPVRTPNAPTVWETASRLGARLRSARAASQRDETGSHSRPRPHVRRAHWHHFWSGPKDGDRKLVLRWVHPVLVAGQAIVPTVRQVD